MCLFGKYSKIINKNNDLQYDSEICWTENDEIKIEFVNYSLSLFIDDVEVYKCTLKQYPKLNKKQLIPVICVYCTSKCDFLGVTVTQH